MSKRKERVIQFHRAKAKRRGAQLRLCPSAWWADEVGSGRVNFPPPANDTPMVQCQADPKTCGRMYPFYYGQGCECEDCRQVRLAAWIKSLRQDGLIAGPLPDEEAPLPRRTYSTSSTSAIVQQALADAHGEVVSHVELATEDESALRNQIERYRQIAAEQGEQAALDMTFNFGSEI